MCGEEMDKLMGKKMQLFYTELHLFLLWQVTGL